VGFGGEAAGDGFTAGRELGLEIRKGGESGEVGMEYGLGGRGRAYMPRLEPVMIAVLLAMVSRGGRQRE
jgi:hypothetical protein